MTVDPTCTAENTELDAKFAFWAIDFLILKSNFRNEHLLWLTVSILCASCKERNTVWSEKKP